MYFPFSRQIPPTPSVGTPVPYEGTIRSISFGLVAAFFLTTPTPAYPCACGCGIYEVGTSSMLPVGSGLSYSLDYNFQDQDRNWSGSSEAPAAANPDKDIRTNFTTLGVQDVLGEAWSLQAALPFVSRHFETTGGASGSDLVSLNFNGVGDLRFQAIYTGLSPGFVSGLSVGLKLPTGSFTRNDAYGDIDRDTEIGSGSTDLILGAFRRLDLGPDIRWSGIAQVMLDLPVLTQSGYRPGAEIDAAFGAYFSGWRVRGVLISPALQLKASVRDRDGGPNATHPVASGFERLLAVPGLEVDLRPIKVNAEVGLPLYQHLTGNQLAASALFKFEVTYAY
jgi:Putative MetA-pathway of phenol degradation